MQNNSTDKVGIREFSMMLLLIIGAKLADTTPVLLFKRAKNGAWMLPIISAIIILPSFFTMLSLLKKYKNKNLIDIVYLLMGKLMGFIYGISLGAILLMVMIISTRDICDTITTMFYPQTPPIAIYFLFMASAVFICRKGLEALSGACWLFVPILVLVITLSILLTIPDMRIQYIYPIGGIKPIELFKGIPFFAAMTSEVILFSVLYPEVKSFDEYKKGSLIGLLVGSFFISCICITYLLVFDVMAVQQVAFPFLELTRIIRIGRFVSNAEAAFLGFWIVGSTLRFSILLYIVTKLFLNTFHKNELKPYFPLFASLIIFFGLLPENYIFLLFQLRKYVLLCGFLIIIPLPYILHLLSMRKGGG